MKRYLEKIVHTIIPHQKNGNIPHILQEEFVVVIAVFVGVLFYFNQNNFDIIKNLNLSATVYPAVLADLANQDRAVVGAPKLTWNNNLEQAAKLKAEDMLKNSYFAHTSPSGLTPWHWLSEVNYNFSYAGENLAVDFSESKNVEDAWLNSPKHKENIINSHFTEIGVATSEGIFEGKKTTFVVEFFGSPAKNKIAEQLAPTGKLKVDNTNKIVTPSVAGESIKNEPEIKTIKETEEFVVARNEDAESGNAPTLSDNPESQPVSTWFERFVVKPTKTIKSIYTVILGLILISVLLVLSKEYQRHHKKHLIMGVVLIILIAVLLYIISK